MPNEDSLNPKSGARFLFERTSKRDDGANYDASILTAENRVDYKAVLFADGAVELSAVGAAAEDALEKKLKNIAVVIARGSKRKRSDGLDPWPERILRWRNA